MLQQWLDENMQRVLTQALREELEDPRAARRLAPVPHPEEAASGRLEG